MSRPFDDEQTVHGDLELVRALRATRRLSVIDQLRGPGAPRRYVLDAPEVVVGRSAQATISIDSHLISRRHLTLHQQGPTYRAQDLESSNGLYLNGVRIHSATLFDGDELQLGDVLLIFRESGG